MHAHMRIRAAIFDFDGTLADTEAATCGWIADLLRPHGLTWTQDLHKCVAGTAAFFPARCLDLLEVDAARRQELLSVLPPRLTSPEYNSYMASRAAIKPGAVALIQRLASRRLPLALCSSRRADSFEAMEATRPDIAELLAPLAVRVVGSVDPRTGAGLRGKPDPQVFAVCAEILGVDPAQCVVFEDAPSGVQSAKSAGAFTVAVPEAWMRGDERAEQVFASADLRLASLADVDEAGIFGAPPPLLLGCENPIVDLTCHVDRAELAQLGLAPGTEATGLDDAAKATLVDYAIKKGIATLSPGGAVLNSIRVAAWRGGPALRTAFVGAVGQDARAEVLRGAMRKLGVVPLLKKVSDLDTAVCACFVDQETHDRTLATIRGAAAALDPAFIRTPAVAALVDEASMLYVSSFVLSTQPRIAAVEELAGRVLGRRAALAINLGSANILQRVLEPLMRLLPRCRYVFGNTGELHAFGACLKWPTQAGEGGDFEAAKRLASMLAEGGVAVITAGAGPTTVAESGREAHRFPVPEAVAAGDIVDTTGAGDAFVGGFLARAIGGAPSLEDCVAAGHECARFVLSRPGCDLDVPEGAAAAGGEDTTHK